MGVNPITFLEMEAFFRLQGIVPNPEEIVLLEMFDNMTVSHHNKKQAAASKASKKPASKPGR